MPSAPRDTILFYDKWKCAWSNYAAASGLTFMRANRLALFYKKTSEAYASEVGFLGVGHFFHRLALDLPLIHSGGEDSVLPL
jgi:hypothetical protein